MHGLNTEFAESVDAALLDACLELQQDEIAALEAIYDSNWRCVDINKFEIDVELTEVAQKVLLTITFTETYPLNEPPLFELSAPWMKSVEKEVLHNVLIDCYLSNYKEPVVFKWITEINEFANNYLQNKQHSSAKLDKSFTPELPNWSAEKLLNVGEHIVSSELILEKKSYFQGHCLPVHSQCDVDNLMLFLRSIPKIAKATHNILAYRYFNEKNVLNCDYDEDGETNAGGRVSHLLELLKVNNVAVVVSRWFGGVLLGPDRFKLINQAARSALVKGKFIT